MAINTEIGAEKYKEILRSNGILDKVSEVTIKDSGAKHDGMASLTQCVTVTFENPEKAPFQFFVKVHTDNESHSAMLEELKAFEKEARFFMEYLPAAKELCKSKGLDNFIDFYPKCYYGDEALIVLENLVLEKGYELLPYSPRHDIDAATLALKTLGKHHGISYAMIQENGGDNKFFERFPNLDHDGLAQPVMVNMMCGSFENAITTNITIVEKHPVENSGEILETLRGFSGTVTETIMKAMKCEKDKDGLLVLNHGDYKNNNMMYLKDKETGKVVQQIAIDLQVTRYNSPALDLGYYLFSSVSHNLRQTRLEELLNIYRQAFNDTCRILGHPMELSLEDLLLQYRRKFMFGFFIALTMVGPGMELTKRIDINEIDVKDWVNVFNKHLQDWIDENPGKGQEMVDDIKNLVCEYKKYAIII